MFNSDMQAALLEIIDDINYYSENIRILIDIPEGEEFDKKSIQSCVENLNSYVNYLSKIFK